ncbi:hypothetical protein DB347_17665 [Opitutaceae bacterium EW11]|nr:hypothetical protein DB347_17665 [Opitutaceae bacterium EW11]
MSASGALIPLYLAEERINWAGVSMVPPAEAAQWYQELAARWRNEGYQAMERGAWSEAVEARAERLADGVTLEAFPYMREDEYAAIVEWLRCVAIERLRQSRS